jgi:hypothetical protein
MQQWFEVNNYCFVSMKMKFLKLKQNDFFCENNFLLLPVGNVVKLFFSGIASPAK